MKLTRRGLLGSLFVAPWARKVKTGALSTKEVARIFRVPHYLIGLERSTYSNIAEMNRIFAQSILDSYRNPVDALTRIEQNTRRIA